MTDDHDHIVALMGAAARGVLRLVADGDPVSAADKASVRELLVHARKAWDAADWGRCERCIVDALEIIEKGRH
jgi:hypothetical protein